MLVGVSIQSAVLQEVGKVNMNALGDDHVSFTASQLNVSPCGKYLLVSTDGTRIVMFRIAGENPADEYLHSFWPAYLCLVTVSSLADWDQMRNFFGLAVEQFHQPAVVWHPSGFYFFAAAAHGQVYVFHVGSAKVSICNCKRSALLQNSSLQVHVA